LLEVKKYWAYRCPDVAEYTLIEVEPQVTITVLGASESVEGLTGLVVVVVALELMAWPCRPGVRLVGLALPQALASVSSPIPNSTFHSARYCLRRNRLDLIRRKCSQHPELGEVQGCVRSR